MNKTVTINISGIVFHIEEDAYDKLSKYLNTISGYFNDSDGRDEIMSDIQARIAEMLQERTSAVKQAVIMADVEHVIAVMGKPEEFAEEKDAASAGSKEAEEQSHENNINYREGKHRRLFRDPDDKWVGGVCSGIANYFDCDPLWIRVLCIVAAFIAGSGAFLYILLMIIIPKARTTAEKLEMRGERVDINSIKRSVDEEIQDFKNKAKSFGDEIKEWGANSQPRNGFERFLDFLKDVFGNMFRVLGKLFTVLFVIVGLILLSVFISLLFAYKGTNSILPNQLDELLFNGGYLSTTTVIGLILVIAIPLLAIIYRGITALFGVRKKNPVLNRISAGLWIVGVGLLVFVSIKVGYQFSARARSRTTVTFTPIKNNTYYLNTINDINNDDEDDDRPVFLNFNNGRHRFNLRSWGRIDDESGKVFLGYPVVDIQLSQNDSMQLIVTRIAHGEDKKEAFNRTKTIVYNVVQRDSLIEFPSFFEIRKADKFRAQQVKMTLYVPKGKIIYLGEGMSRIIYDIDNVSNTYDGDMINHNWEMTEKGLKCLNCPNIIDDDSDFELPESPGAPPPPPGKRKNINKINIKADNKEIIIENKE